MLSKVWCSEIKRINDVVFNDILSDSLTMKHIERIKNSTYSVAELV